MLHALNPGVAAALLAAALFGAGTPAAKFLLGQVNPWLLAALLYLGSGLGLWCLRCLRRAPAERLAPGERPWLAAAVVAGGVVGPAMLMLGLSQMPASGASLLLNAEGMFTALIAWFVFKEHVDQRIALGMAAILAGSVVLAWPNGPGSVQWGTFWPSLAVLCACLAWAIDNNLTRKVSLADASWIAMVKGLVAGAVNLTLVLLLQPQVEWPPLPLLGAAAMLGFASYGASLTLFVVGLRHLGAARTGAYFSVAPFWGAMLAIALLDEPVTMTLVLAGVLMVLGVVLHLTERHEHRHTHEPITHDHEHDHGPNDLHHHHDHAPASPGGARHAHLHTHDAVTHSHTHFPDLHHQHRH